MESYFFYLLHSQESFLMAIKTTNKHAVLHVLSADLFTFAYGLWQISVTKINFCKNAVNCLHNLNKKF